MREFWIFSWFLRPAPICLAKLITVFLWTCWGLLEVMFAWSGSEFSVNKNLCQSLVSSPCYKRQSGQKLKRIHAASAMQSDELGILCLTWAEAASRDQTLGETQDYPISISWCTVRSSIVYHFTPDNAQNYSKGTPKPLFTLKVLALFGSPIRVLSKQLTLPYLIQSVLCSLPFGVS